MKRYLPLVMGLIAAVSVTGMAACSNHAEPEQGSRLIEVTVAGNDPLLWTAIRDDFNKANEKGYTVEFSVAPDPEVVLENRFNNGKAPDLVLLPTGRGEGFTEELVRSRALNNLEGVLDCNVFGETVKLRDKILNGFLSTSATNPYQSELASDTDSYMLPVFFQPYGLFYNKDLVTPDGAAEGTYKLPATWDAYLSLRPSVSEANEDVAESEMLFMYGYGDAQANEAIIAPTVASYGGITLAERMLNYDYIYDNAKFNTALSTFGDINSLLSTGETESGFGNYVLATDAAQALINKKLLFLAGGADTFAAFTADGIENYDASKIGFTASFAANDSSQRYAMTEFEQAYIPAQSDNAEGAEQFLLYLFSDRAADIMLSHGRVLPTRYALDHMQGHVSAEEQLLFNVFADGSVRPCSGQEAFIDASVLATLEADWNTSYTGTFATSVLLGRNTQVWTDNLKSNAVKLRSALLGN